MRIPGPITLSEKTPVLREMETNIVILTKLCQGGSLDKDKIKAIQAADLKRTPEYGARIAAVTALGSKGNLPCACEL